MLNKPDSAITILEEVIPIFKSEGNLYLQMNALAQLSRAYYKKGQIELALATMDSSNALDPNQQYLSQAIYNYQLMGKNVRGQRRLE